MRLGIAFVVCVVAGSLSNAAASGGSVDVRAQAKGAERVVIARVKDVSPRFDVNAFGDSLIVSQSWLEVEDSLKGPHSPLLSVEVEGGTIGDLTLRVSDMPTLRKGERAVFFLDATATGAHKPHRRGLGVLKLDSAGRVAGSSVTVGEVKQLVRDALK